MVMTDAAVGSGRVDAVVDTRVADASASDARAGAGSVDELLSDLLIVAMLICGQVALLIALGNWRSGPAMIGAALLVGPFLAATVAHPLLSRTVTIPEPRFIGYLLLGLPFAFLSQVVTMPGPAGVVFQAAYVGLYCHAIAVIRIYGPRGRPRLPVTLLAVGFSFSTAGYALPHTPYLILVIIQGTLICIALRRGLPRAPSAPSIDRETAARRRRGHRARLGVALGLLVVSSVILCVVARIYYDDVNRVISKITFGGRSRGGFSNTATLGSIASLKASGGDTIAIRSFGAEAPGYLRGGVFLGYDKGTWEPAVSTKQTAESRPLYEGRWTFLGRLPPAVEAAPDFEIYPAGQYGRHYFLPIESNAVEATDKKDVLLWPGDVLTVSFGSTARGYGVFVDESQPIPGTTGDPEWLAPPEDPALVASLDRVLESIARERSLPRPIGEATIDIDRWVAALTLWFEARYDYRVGIDLDPDRDPVIQFLEEKSHGHCELFAAAGTLLLRRLGIPARYVTGFVCEEKNSWGDLYVARSRHAHAWVEIGHPERGWIVGEMTPPDAAPDTSEPSSLAAFGEWLWGLVEQARGLLARGGIRRLMELSLRGVREAVLWLVGAWWRIALLVAGAGLFVWRRSRRKSSDAIDVALRDLSPELLAERHRLALLEEHLAKLGFPRRSSETLHEYALRLQRAELEGRDEAVTFLRTYALRRYAPDGAGLAR